MKPTNQQHIFDLLQEHGPMTAKALTARIGISTVGEYLSKMRSAGLLREARYVRAHVAHRPSAVWELAPGAVRPASPPPKPRFLVTEMSLSRAILLQFNVQPMTASALARVLGVPLTSVARACHTLANRGRIEEDGRERSPLSAQMMVRWRVAVEHQPQINPIAYVPRVRRFVHVEGRTFEVMNP